MSSLFANSELFDLIKKVENNEPFSSADGIRLLNSQDILSIGYMANLIRERKQGNQTQFTVNRQIEYTHKTSSSFEELKQLIREAVSDGVKEINVVGEVNSELPFNYYIGFLQQMRESFPKLIIKAFNTDDIKSLIKISGLPISEVLKQLLEAGLDSLLDDSLAGEGWREIQETAHALGMRTSAVLNYGNLESKEDRINQLLRLKDLQDKTGGFISCIPIPFCPVDLKFESSMGSDKTTGFEDIKMAAVSRILLSNFEHIGVNWTMLGPKLAQVSLAFGTDSLQTTTKDMSRKALTKMIQKAGRDAVEQNNLYRVLETL